MLVLLFSNGNWTSVGNNFAKAALTLVVGFSSHVIYNKQVKKPTVVIVICHPWYWEVITGIMVKLRNNFFVIISRAFPLVTIWLPFKSCRFPSSEPLTVVFQNTNETLQHYLLALVGFMCMGDVSVECFMCPTGTYVSWFMRYCLPCPAGGWLFLLHYFFFPTSVIITWCFKRSDWLL